MTHRVRILLGLLLGGLLMACGASQPTLMTDRGPLPPPQTTAVLAGPLCQGSQCQCREESAPGAGGAGEADADYKRYEFRVGPSDGPQWVIVDGKVLYKSAERATECFYLDLAVGDHTVALRAEDDSGVQPSLKISEYGKAAETWYRSFAFVCGDGAMCSSDDLASQKADYAKVTGGLHDRCGSTKISQLTWDSSRPPDGLHPSVVMVQLALKVSRATPTRASGDPSCSEQP